MLKESPLDYKLDNLFKQKRNGFYIELGANNGISQSNTAFFEFNREWKGVLIEPSPSGYQSCIKYRPKSHCFNYACVSSDCSDIELTGDFDGHLMSSVDGSRRNKRPTVTVKTNTLTKILDTIPDISSIDLLSLDTEGYELNILKGIDLSKYRPAFMLIEVYTKDYENIINYLKEHNYICHSNFSAYNKKEHPH